VISGDLEEKSSDILPNL